MWSFDRKFLIALLASCFALVTEVRAQGTVYGYQDNFLYGFAGTQLSNIACTEVVANRTTACIPVEKMTGVAFDVTFLDANSSANYLEINCNFARAQNCPVLFQMPVVTATSAGGVSTIKPAFWQWKSSGGGAPGTSNFMLTITNIPAPFIQCVFTCGAGGAAEDRIGAFVRGLTP